MEAPRSISLLDHFATLPDCRRELGQEHALLDIVGIAICATLAGADSWVAIAKYGEAKQTFLGRFLSLEHGVPSHDTFRNVFCKLDPAAFANCFQAWVAALAQVPGLRHVALDGKTVRGSARPGKGKAALHLVSAWATEASLTLGQVAVDGKSNEITAIPKLLAVLDLAGALVTYDAMGCQKEVAAKVTAAGGDYILAVKDNQPRLHEDVQAAFAAAQADGLDGCAYAQEEATAHGREEFRSCTLLPADAATVRDFGLWAGLCTLCMIVRRCVRNGKESIETAYYIGSLKAGAADYLRAVRRHWSIENQLHWVLDVTFREDAARHHSGNSVENLALLRKLALCLLKNEKTSKDSLINKRLACGWNDDYLTKVLQAQDINGA
jgi:predicted transposase YbfD/YdcC